MIDFSKRVEIPLLRSTSRKWTSKNPAFFSRIRKKAEVCTSLAENSCIISASGVLVFQAKKAALLRRAQNSASKRQLHSCYWDALRSYPVVELPALRLRRATSVPSPRDSAGFLCWSAPLRSGASRLHSAPPTSTKIPLRPAPTPLRPAAAPPLRVATRPQGAGNPSQSTSSAGVSTQSLALSVIVPFFRLATRLPSVLERRPGRRQLVCPGRALAGTVVALAAIQLPSGAMTPGRAFTTPGHLATRPP